MRILDMAFRNLGRNRRRSLLALSSVFIAIMLVLVMNGLINGFLESMIRNYTKNDVGHVHIATSGYRARERFMPVDETIPDTEAVLSALAAMPELKGRVKVVAERIRFGTLLSSGSMSKPAFALAGEPETERELAMLDRSVLPGGAYIAGRGQTILGAKLADDLGLNVGDTLKVVTQRADYGLGFKRFTIVGLVKTGANALDGMVFQIGIDDARELLGIEGAQQILLMLDRSDFAPEAASLVREALKAKGLEGLSVLPWTENGSFPSFILMAKGLYGWFYLVFALLGAFIITNIMMMVVLERRREIGILKSMGMPRGELLGLFLLEGTLLGFGGSLLGSVLGTALNLVLGTVGFDMSAAMAGFSWPMDNVIYPIVNLASAALFVLMGTAVASAMSFLPSRSAARMNAVDAIRSI